MERFREDCDGVFLSADFIEFLRPTRYKHKVWSAGATIFLPMGLLLEEDFDLLLGEVFHRIWPSLPILSNWRRVYTLNIDNRRTLS